MLVEDEPAVRDLAHRILRSAGYHVLSAEDPDHALLLVEQHAGAINLLLTDVVMPHMSGKALADRLLRAAPEMLVLKMSGYTDNAIVHHGVLDVGTNVIAKPFTADQRLRKVRDVLDAPRP